MEEIESKKFYEFKKTIKKLKEIRGTGTQLVSFYIPAGYPIPEAAAKIREEISQAQNIKSKQTRTAVISALERISNALKHFKSTPEKGLVMFAGNISNDPSREDIQIFIIEPLYRLGQSIYRCDSSFFLEPLEKMLESTDSYGIVAIEGREATLALLRGTEVNIVERIENQAHAKVRKGGQSARRYERLIEEAIERFYKKVGEAMDKHFLGKVKGIIVGGPGPTKDYFLKESPFNYQHKILGVVDTGYADENGVYEIMNKMEGIIKEQEAVKEKALLTRFISEVVKGGKAIYGYAEVVEAIKTGRAFKVLVSEGLDQNYFLFKCQKDDTTIEIITPKEQAHKKRTSPETCPQDGTLMTIIEDEDLTDHIIKIAMESNIDVEVISTNTQEGQQFLKGFKGIGAFLKY
ncbi:MAG: peptide chain release factor aRF-1 [Candidatus Anstonellales archaeon]